MSEFCSKICEVKMMKSLLSLGIVFIVLLIVEAKKKAKITDCPAMNLNLQRRKNSKDVRGVKTWQQCANECEKKDGCKYWTWHKAGNRWQFICVLMTGYSYSNKDSNVISGKVRCQSSNNEDADKKVDVKKDSKGDITDCPANNLNLQRRKKSKNIRGVKTWQECAKKCEEKHGCKYWIWHKAGNWWQFICVLMEGYSYSTKDSNVLSGKVDCQSSTTGMSEEDKELIISTHNSYRSGVHPTASNMEKMYWDDKLAQLAQKWADTCPGGHDTNDVRSAYMNWGFNIGQNMAWNGAKMAWSQAVTMWYNEVSDFEYGTGSTGGVTGHYTQVIWAGSARVGCAFKDCPNKGMRYHYVCNYAYGNMREADTGTVTKPYASSGTSCSECGICNNNMCDCGGKICQNGGVLDVGTCECTCLDLYKGDECEIMNCPDEDPRNPCGSWNAGFCESYPTYVPPRCPHMCGLC